jgi:hypothetical protein
VVVVSSRSHNIVVVAVWYCMLYYYVRHNTCLCLVLSHRLQILGPRSHQKEEEKKNIFSFLNFLNFLASLFLFSKSQSNESELLFYSCARFTVKISVRFEVNCCPLCTRKQGQVVKWVTPRVLRGKEESC